MTRKPATRTKPATATVSARVDARLKADAEAVLRDLGLTAADAVRLFYQQVAEQKRLPFNAKIPNAETRQAMKDLDEGKNVTRYVDFEEFRKAMLGD